MTMKSVFYFNMADRFWVPIIRSLNKRLEFAPAYIVADEKNFPAVCEIGRHVFCHSSIDAIRGVGYPVVGEADDFRLLEALAPAERIVLKMMDRMDPCGHFSYQNRREFFYHLVNVCGSTLNKYAPDLLFFSSAPHMVYDYIYYVIAKHRGIETVLVDRTGLKALSCFSRDVHSPPDGLLTRYKLKREESKVDYSEFVERNFRDLKGSYSSAMPEHSIGQMKDIQRQSLRYERNWFNKFKYKAPSFFKENIDRLTRKAAPPNYFVESHKMPFESEFTAGEWRRTYRKILDRRIADKKRYESLAKTHDLTTPYILVALQKQPERTTSPLADIFVDQYLVVEMLSRLGTRVLVKEHPTQFLQLGKFDSSRRQDYYLRMTELPNVSLVSLDQAPFELIDHAEAIVTMTGSIGWEALVRQKPVLIFGNAWYQGCHGTFKIQALEDLIEAYSAIKRGVTISDNDVKDFAAAYEEIGGMFFVDGFFKRLLQIGQDENAERFLDCFEKFVHHHLQDELVGQ